jgi:hypothetical protein
MLLTFQKKFILKLYSGKTIIGEMRFRVQPLNFQFPAQSGIVAPIRPRARTNPKAGQGRAKPFFHFLTREAGTPPTPNKEYPAKEEPLPDPVAFRQSRKIGGTPQLRERAPSNPLRGSSDSSSGMHSLFSPPDSS